MHANAAQTEAAMRSERSAGLVMLSIGFPALSSAWQRLRRWGGHWACVDRRFAAERVFHLAAKCSRFAVDGLDIVPAYRAAQRDRAPQLHAVREPYRQARARERITRRHELPVYGIAALAVERFAGEQLPFRGGYGIAAKGRGDSGWLAAQADRSDADAELQADQVIRFVHGRVFARIVGDQAVFLEAVPHVVAVGTKRDVYAPAQVAEYRPAVALHARNHFHLTFVIELPAAGARAHHAREIVDSARRKRQSLRCRRKSRSIGDRRHLD